MTDHDTLEILRQHVRAIADFPKPGILFRDIMPVLCDPQAHALAIDAHVDAIMDMKSNITKVVAIEARGFLFGPAVAARLGVGFCPVRKPGKLPGEVVREEYALEYGTDAIEMHPGGVARGDAVLVVDDLLATGGTAEATCSLVDRLGGRIAGCLFMIELDALGGRARLEAKGHRVDALIQY